MNHLDFRIGHFRRDKENAEIVEKFFGRCAKGNSSTQSNPTTTTTTNVSDQRVAASEGSVSAGAGASVSIQSSDAETTKANLDAITRIAATANDTTEKTATAAITGNVKAVDIAAELGKAALSLGGESVKAVTTGQRDALDFGSGVVVEALKAARGSQESANDLIRATNENFVGHLASNAGPAPTALAGDTIKYIAIAAAVVVGAVLLKPSK